MQRFTQAADGHETAEQRKRRMKRFDDKHSSTDNTWAKLLEDGSISISKRKEGIEKAVTTPAGKKAKAKEEDDSDDVVLLQTLHRPVVSSASSSSGVSPQHTKSKASPTPSVTPWIEWSKCRARIHSSPLPTGLTPMIPSACRLCTLRNSRSSLRCEACDTTRGKVTLGA